MFLVHQTGAALGSWLGGALFEATGDHGAAFGLSSTRLIGASLLSLAIDERPRLVPRLSAVAGGT
jgi:predicted MFS family arabinose efflux permease